MVQLPIISSSLATRLTFFIAGFVTATWAVIVPYARANTGVNEATLGTLLLCLGVGALIAMPLTGSLTTRFGCRRVIVAALALVMLSTPLLAAISHPVLLGLVLLVFGIGVGVTDCAMNIQAILVEKASPAPLMSGFHGMYSFGGIAGAGLMTLLLTLGINVIVATMLITLTVIVLTALSYPGLLTYANPREGAAFAMPRGIVLLLGMVCFSVFLTEGTVLDWSAVYLTQVRDMPETLGGLGYTCFAVAMTAARMTGDRVVANLGRLTVVVGGALTAAAGLALIIFIASWPLSLIGYILIGAGCANIVPVMFSAVGQQSVMPQSVAVPAMTTMGYLGVLSGPAVIGYVAHFSSLTLAFSFIMALMVFVGAVSFTLNLDQRNSARNNA
ncbi:MULTISPECIES: MFS transporter [unclassified Pantoea]|uniref:MFS transporter n=1 Tax=unclassified Pantoea TaxID=2630326 RepID=UPI001CD3460A|nr:MULTISPECIES: MFS transporter [unclassified Pantoea]MCA1177391.1 MFS transporter [Pantoea sp. alder69]MCA1249703.1 MFS transporter [Pantoea sp. alder70]MCA1265880.1 MFS transporter [Pantoea sp. alder81]